MSKQINNALKEINNAIETLEELDEISQGLAKSKLNDVMDNLYNAISHLGQSQYQEKEAIFTAKDFQRIDNKQELLLVAFYLSKYEHNDLFSLNQAESFQEISDIINIKATTIKFIRDWFDALVVNNRKGFRNKPIPPYIQRFYDQYKDLAKESHFEKVAKILKLK